MAGYSEKQGKLLVMLARITIGKRLGIDFDKVGLDKVGLKDLQPRDYKQQLKQEIFEKKQGVFVTLHINGQLRGCIGSLEPDEAVRKGVARNALNAAFNDPRFPPLGAVEFEDIDVEVSVLSNPEPLVFSTWQELVSKLVPERDGVIIKKNRGRATFLPQVWEQLPKVDDFLSHLCVKAGFAPDEWKRPGLEVSTYQVQYFS